ncbi:MAG: F0F1 ATP synthase subunit A [Bradymonadia bacterium]
MGEHDTWFHLLPGFKNLEHTVAHGLGKSYLDGEEIHGLGHVVMALVVFGLLIFLGLRYKAAVAADKDGGVIPSDKLNARGIVEIISGAVLGMMKGIMPEKAARHFLPLIGTLAFFILFSNLFGLVPGFLPATDVLSTTLACSIVVFFATHIYGVKEHGMAYFKHFLGPVPALAPLMLPIELVSHFARPASLALRLMGNMFGDHKVLAIFLGLVPLIVPIPILVLGTLVCVVQTLVFCMLSTVYIALAIEHDH